MAIKLVNELTIPCGCICPDLGLLVDAAAAPWEFMEDGVAWIGLGMCVSELRRRPSTMLAC